MFMIPMVIMEIESDADRAYMTDVYMNHRSLMLKVAWRYTSEPAEVEDIVSESCVSLIQHLDSIRFTLLGRRQLQLDRAVWQERNRRRIDARRSERLSYQHRREPWR